MWDLPHYIMSKSQGFRLHSLHIFGLGRVSLKPRLSRCRRCRCRCRFVVQSSRTRTVAVRPRVSRRFSALSSSSSASSTCRCCGCVCCLRDVPDIPRLLRICTYVYGRLSTHTHTRTRLRHVKRMVMLTVGTGLKRGWGRLGYVLGPRENCWDMAVDLTVLAAWLAGERVSGVW